jgi:hypothetical protein
MKVEKTSTGLIIHQPTDEIKRKCLRYFSLSDPVREYFIYSGKDTKKVPIFGKEHDVIYITSGFLSLNDQAIRQLRPFVHTITSPDGSTVHVTMNRQPRSKLQEDCIHSIITSKSSKITIEVKPGVDHYRHPRMVTCVKNSQLNCWDE